MGAAMWPRRDFTFKPMFLAIEDQSMGGCVWLDVFSVWDQTIRYAVSLYAATVGRGIPCKQCLGPAYSALSMRFISNSIVASSGAPSLRPKFVLRGSLWRVRNLVIIFCISCFLGGGRRGKTRKDAGKTR